MDIDHLSTSQLVITGGDDRLLLDPTTGLNAYGCSPEPRPVVSYSSSTASSISAAAFEQIRSRHNRLILRLREQSEADVYRLELERIRTRLRGIFRLPEDTEIAFSPSGTDLELLVLMLALAGPEGRVRNLLVGEDEVGTGCVHSALGQHFRECSALGVSCLVGETLSGFPADKITLQKIEVRRADGRARPAEEILERMVEEIESALSQGERPLVHVIHRSKTGVVVPTWEQVEGLFSRYGERIDITVDACQGRLSPDNLAGYLRMGATVMSTGSKFIGGPPFSGFLFVPLSYAVRTTSMPVPVGLAEYFNRAEWPIGWRVCDKVLPLGANFGLLLRLEAAVYELERLAALPHDRVLAVVRVFGESVRALTERNPRFRLFIAAEGLRPQTHIEHPFERDMLFTLQIVGNRTDGGPLDIDDGKKVYQALYKDLSDRFTDPVDRAVGAEICHVGQPIRCLCAEDGTKLATIRLSLSARLISCLAGMDDEAMAERFSADFDRIAAKTELALRLP